VAQCVPLQAVPCPANRYFSAVHRCKVEAREVRLDRRSVPASAVPCIPRGKLLPEPALLELVRRFRLRVQRGRVPVPVDRRGAQVSAMFRAG
jgi:hypothetical protein